jgi:hypothetical protein
MIRTTIKLATILILTIGIMTGAASAQNKNGGNIAPVGIYDGVESAVGTVDLVNSMVWGNSLVMTSYGEWETHHLTVAFDYSTNYFNPLNGYAVTGGSFCLISYRSGKYEGTVYGNLTGGAVLVSTENIAAATKSTNLNLRISGGTGIFDRKDIENLRFSFRSVTDSRSHETHGSAFLPF